MKPDLKLFGPRQVLQETIARTEKIRSEFETLRVRVEKLEELRDNQDQPKESQSIDANLSEPPP
ncbi:hypothetical protein, partial [Rhizobium leguminosarum]|uniref:hypothetical protein n=1 Tax=Rhizobium leguminosarum TaxID=384 RepID=UPI003F9905C9